MVATRILITGSRDYVDGDESRDALVAVLKMLAISPAEAVLVHGAAKGADTVCAAAATGLGMVTEAHPAQWDVHEGCSCRDHSGRCGFAGFRRNAHMLSRGANVCLGFPLHPEKLPPGSPAKNTSRGTWNMIRAAANAGVPTFAVLHVGGQRVLRRVTPS